MDTAMLHRLLEVTGTPALFLVVLAYVVWAGLLVSRDVHDEQRRAADLWKAHAQDYQRVLKELRQEMYGNYVDGSWVEQEHRFNQEIVKAVSIRPVMVLMSQGEARPGLEPDPEQVQCWMPQRMLPWPRQY